MTELKRPKRELSVRNRCNALTSRSVTEIKSLASKFRRVENIIESLDDNEGYVEIFEAEMIKIHQRIHSLAYVPANFKLPPLPIRKFIQIQNYNDSQVSLDFKLVSVAQLRKLYICLKLPNQFDLDN